jgi:hypothetical protein
MIGFILQTSSFMGVTYSRNISCNRGGEQNWSIDQVELAKNRETRIPVGILVENSLSFYKFSKCLLPKNESLKNPPLLLNLP